MGEIILEGHILAGNSDGLHQIVRNLLGSSPLPPNWIKLSYTVKEGKLDPMLVYNFSGEAMVSAKFKMAISKGCVLRESDWNYLGHLELRTSATQGFHESLYEHYLFFREAPPIEVGDGNIKISYD